MRWELQSAQSFVEHREYVDTAVIPLFKLQFEEELLASTAAATWLTMLVHHIEEQLKGRIMLFPTLSFTSSLSAAGLSELLLSHRRDISAAGFKRVVFMTLEGGVSAEVHTIIDEQEQVYILETNVPEQNQIDVQKVTARAGEVVKQLIRLWQ